MKTLEQLIDQAILQSIRERRSILVTIDGKSLIDDDMLSDGEILELMSDQLIKLEHVYAEN